MAYEDIIGGTQPIFTAGMGIDEGAGASSNFVIEGRSRNGLLMRAVYPSVLPAFSTRTISSGR